MAKTLAEINNELHALQSAKDLLLTEPRKAFYTGPAVTQGETKEVFILEPSNWRGDNVSVYVEGLGREVHTKLANLTLADPPEDPKREAVYRKGGGHEERVTLLEEYAHSWGVRAFWVYLHDQHRRAWVPENDLTLVDEPVERTPYEKLVVAIDKAKPGEWVDVNEHAQVFVGRVGYGHLLIFDDGSWESLYDADEVAETVHG